MPLQNRVDPFSRLHANPARGLFTGNRGILHDDDGQIARWRGQRPYAPAINDDIREEMGPILNGGPHEMVEAALLPAGAMYALGDDAYLVQPTGPRRWTFDGYGQLERFPVTPVRRLTPKISIAALEGGFTPVLHSSASAPN